MRDDSDIVAILWCIYIYRSIGHLFMRSIAENMTYIYIHTYNEDSMRSSMGHTFYTFVYWLFFQRLYNLT